MIWFWLCWALGGKVLVQAEIQWPVAVEVVGDALWVLDHPGHGLSRKVQFFKKKETVWVARE